MTPSSDSRGVLVLIGCLGIMLTGASDAGAQQVVPTDFADLPVIGGLDRSIAIDFVPGARLFVIEQNSARLRLIVNGALSSPDPVLVVDSVSTAGGEQGLLGIAVDPGWPGRPYVYVQYDYAGAPVIRISRYTVGGDLSYTGDGSLTVDPASRYDILVDLPDNMLHHNGGTLRFGPDGMLYSSLGDDGDGCLAQDVMALQGKILRLDVSALPAGPGGPAPLASITPPDNPFAGHANPRARLVYVLGLRNPFAFEIDRLTGDLVIGDVGGDLWEEVDWATQPGMNFGWMHWEGPERTGTICAGADTTSFAPPIHAYPNPEPQPVSVIGGPVYRRPSGAPNRFPPEYEGDIFFTDFYQGWIRRLKHNGSAWGPASPVAGQVNPSDWALGNGLITNLRMGPDGALWYCQGFSGFFQPMSGQIRRIVYTGTVSVSDGPLPGLEFRAPFPSPSRGTVSFAYVLPVPARIDLEIYDLSGRRVRSIVVGERQHAGPQGVTWDGRDGGGRAASPGVYLARLTVGSRRLERRFVLL